MFAGYGPYIFRIALVFVGSVTSLMLILLGDRLGTGLNGQLIGGIIFLFSGGWMSYRWVHNLYIRQRDFKGTLMIHTDQLSGNAEDKPYFVRNTYPIEGSSELEQFLPSIAARMKHRPYSRLTIEWMKDFLANTKKTIEQQREIAAEAIDKKKTTKNLTQEELKKIQDNFQTISTALGKKALTNQLDLQVLLENFSGIADRLSEDLDDLAYQYNINYCVTEAFLNDGERDCRKTFISIAPMGEGILYTLHAGFEILMGKWPSKDKMGFLYNVQVGVHDRSITYDPTKTERIMSKLHLIPQDGVGEIKEPTSVEMVYGSDANSTVAKAKMTGISRFIAPVPPYNQEDQDAIGRILISRDAAPYVAENDVLRERNAELETALTQKGFWKSEFEPTPGVGPRFPKLTWKMILAVGVVLIGIGFVIWVLSRLPPGTFTG